MAALMQPGVSKSDITRGIMTITASAESAQAARNLRLLKFYNLSGNLKIHVPLWVLFCASIHVSLTETASVFMVSFLCKIFTDTPTSLLADRWGYRHCLRLAAVMRPLAFLGMFALAHNFGGFLLWTLMIVICDGCASGASEALARQNTDQPTHDESTWSNLRFCLVNYRLFAVTATSSAAIAWLIMLAGTNDGPRWAYLWEALIAIPLGYTSRFLVEPKRTKHRSRPTSPRPVLKLWPLVGSCSMLFASDYTGFFLMPASYRSMPVAEKWFPAINLAIYSCSFFATFLVARCFRQLGPFGSLRSLMVVHSWTLIVPALLPGYWGLLGVIGIPLQLASLGAVPKVVLLDYTTNHLRATILSVAGTGGAVFATTFNVGLGWLIDHYSVKTALFAAFAVYGLLNTGFALSLRKLKPIRANE